jgi:FdhE protein
MKNGTSRQILEELGEWCKTESLSSKFLDFYKRLLNIQAGAEKRIGIAEIRLTERVIKHRIVKGFPLLRFDELDISWPLVQDIFANVAAAFAGYAELLGDVPQGLIKPAPRSRLPKEIAKAWFEGTSLPSTIADEDISEVLLSTLIHQTLRPFLTNYSKALHGFVSQENWRRGYCPICGGSPDFAFLQGDSGARWLLCSCCDAQWLFQRLECPYCGNKNQTSLSYFTDDGLYRLYVCDECRLYLKTIDLRNTAEEVSLPLARLITFSMDQQGLEMGYRPSSSQTSQSVRKHKAGKYRGFFFCSGTK